MGVIDIDLQGHLAIISNQETAFNVILVYLIEADQGVLHVPNVLLFVTALGRNDASARLKTY